MITFPTITDATLVPFRALQVQLADDPLLFKRSDCPYPTHISAFLLDILDKKERRVSEYSDNDLIQETIDLYDEVKRAGMSSGSVDPKDKMSILKTSADLLNKLVTLRERAMNVRDMSDFQRKVVECLEAVVTPAQRSEFLEKMEKYVGV